MRAADTNYHTTVDIVGYSVLVLHVQSALKHHGRVRTEEMFFLKK
jgi:cytochrome b561